MIARLLSLVFPSREKHIDLSMCLAVNGQPVRLHKEDLRRQGIMYLDSLTARSAYASSKELQQMIRKFKYHRQRSLAAPLGVLLLEAAAHIPLEESMVICPVPLHWTRRFSRGFNQAELLARALSAATGIPLSGHLRRMRPTGHQAWRSHDERRLAMCDAFTSRQSSPHVLLIDDVATTVSTLDACAHALKDAGASHVQALVLALG